MERLTDRQREAVRAYNLAIRDRTLKQRKLNSIIISELNTKQYNYWLSNPHSIDNKRKDLQNTWRNLT